MIKENTKGLSKVSNLVTTVLWISIFVRVTLKSSELIEKNPQYMILILLAYGICSTIFVFFLRLMFKTIIK